MGKFRKKPIIIEAFLWTGDQDQEEDPEWIIDAIKNKNVYFEKSNIFIKTLEGTMKGDSGDYIIKGVNGEIYPCKPDIFEKTYEKVK